MSEIKKFFAHGSELNKGYKAPEERDNRFNEDFSETVINIANGLDATNPGSSEKIIEMASKEQLHRHKMDEIAFQARTKFHRFGQFFALFTVTVIGYFTNEMAQAGLSNEAMAFAVAGFAAIILSSKIASSRGKRREHFRGKRSDFGSGDRRHSKPRPDNRTRSDNKARPDNRTEKRSPKPTEDSSARPSRTRIRKRR